MELTRPRKTRLHFSPKYFKWNTSNIFITVFHCYTNYWFSVAVRHLCQFNASSVVRIFCYITPSTYFSHFISGLPLLILTSVDQVNIRLGYLLFPMRNTY